MLNGERRLLPSLSLKVSIADCAVDQDLRLLYRDRRWVPQSEPLRTKLIDNAHSPVVAGHPGRQVTYRAIARDYFWPGILDDI